MAKDKSSIESERVEELVKASGLPTEDKSAFLMVGPKDGIHLAIAKTKRVGRVYIYRGQLHHKAVTNHDEAFRKEQRYGHIQSEIDFSNSEEDCFDALKQAIRLVQDQPEREPKPVPVPRTPKVKATASPSPEPDAPSVSASGTPSKDRKATVKAAAEKLKKK